MTDGAGSTAVTQVAISARPPVTVTAAGSPTTGSIPLTVSFSGSASGGTGGPYTYSWSFGATTANATNTYNSGGTFTETLTVTDSLGDSGSQTVTVTPLSVDLSGTPTSGNFPLTVSFAATACGGSGTYNSYAWTFGDGTTATTTTSTTSHTYASAGAYNAQVTVTDSASISSASSPLTITVTVPTLTATATATPSSGLAPLAVNLGGSASGGVGPYKYAWDFGDGSAAVTGLSNPSTSHTYQVPGTFTAVLTVTDSQTPTAASTTASQSINITPPVPAISSVYPPNGPETGGTSVTITGTYFENASSVKFGSKAATFTAPACDAGGNCTLTATSPAQPAGTVNITVTTPGGTTPAGSSQFTYDLSWAQKASTGPPSARQGSALVNDGSRVVLFGGSDGLTDQNDTWLWNGSAWSQGATPTTMLGRAHGAAAYDSNHGAIVLFGGDCHLLVTCPAGIGDLNDTWIWNPSTSTWTQGQALNLTPGSNQPSARAGAMMVFDGNRGEVVLFGGYDGTSYLNDTWAYNFSAKHWTRLNASNCASTTLPACRAYGSFGRDSSGQGVLFGGSNGSFLGDTWTWSNGAWNSYGLASPSARSMASMGYYNKPGGGTATGLMLFGGQASTATCPSGVCGDTWTWSGNRWQQLYAAGTGGSPPARYDAAAATDSSGGVVLFGGNSGSGQLGDTYLLK